VYNFSNISHIEEIHLWLFAFLQSVNDKKRRGPNDKKGGGPFCNHVNTQKYQHIKLLLNQKKSYWLIICAVCI